MEDTRVEWSCSQISELNSTSVLRSLSYLFQIAVYMGNENVRIYINSSGLLTSWHTQDRNSKWSTTKVKYLKKSHHLVQQPSGPTLCSWITSEVEEMPKTGLFSFGLVWFFYFWWQIYAGFLWFSGFYSFCIVIESHHGWLSSRNIEEKLREGEQREIMSNTSAKPTSRIIAWHHQSHLTIGTSLP